MVVGVDGDHAESDRDELRIDGRVVPNSARLADADADLVLADQVVTRRHDDHSRRRIDRVDQFRGEGGYLTGKEDGGQLVFSEELHRVSLGILGCEREAGCGVGFHADRGDVVQKRVAVGTGVQVGDDCGFEAPGGLVAE